MRYLLSSLAIGCILTSSLFSFSVCNATENSPLDSLSKGTMGISSFHVGGQTFNMIGVRGGSFLMGAQNNDPDKVNYDSIASDLESAVHRVTLTPYNIGETEVTQGLWKAVMRKPLKWTKENGLNDSLPAYLLNYSDALLFVQTLNDSLHASHQLEANQNFTLPTEAQWEFAAKGGTASRHYYYAGSNNPYEAGWYEKNSCNRLHPIAQKKANELGLYDMSGNVWEWCSDFMDMYSTEAETNPTGPLEGEKRIFRGGGYGYDEMGERTTNRGYNVPEYSNINLGLRLCLQ